MKQNTSYIPAVKKSRVLSQEQKQDLLDMASSLPDSYQEKIAPLLETFNNHSEEREVYLRDKLEKTYTEFMKQLDSEGIEESKKNELLAKARKQINAFFPKS